MRLNLQPPSPPAVSWGKPQPAASPAGSDAIAVAREALAGVTAPPCPESDPLPDQLSRNDITCGLGRITPAARACSQRFRETGSVYIGLIVGNDGTITWAQAVGPMNPGAPTAECVRQIVLGAKLPRFTGQPMHITYPFILR